MRKLLLLSLVLSVNAVFGQYSGTPLMLSLPMNQDTIEEDEPVFVWQTTLSNVQNDPRLNVQLSVVKMDQDQTQTEAIVENTPVFIRQNLLSNSLNYSSIDHKLEEGVWYAWQVVLFYNGVQVQQNEVWKFIKVEKEAHSSIYIPLRKQVDNSIYTLMNDQLYVCTNEPGTFQFDARIKGKKLDLTKITIEELVDNKAVKTTESVQQTETRFYHVDLSDLKLKKGIYRFEWTAKEGLTYVVFIEKE